MILGVQTQSLAFDSFLKSSRYKSMAGAGIASTSRIGMEDFGLINPAVLATNADLVFSTGFAKGKSQGTDVSGFSASILDSINGAWNSKRSDYMPSEGFPLASVLYYSNFNYEQMKDQYFQLGIAQPLSSRMSIGLSANYSIMKSDALDVSESVFDFGAGFLWRALNRLTLGVSALNLMDRRDEHIPGYLRRGLGGGLEFAASSSVKIRGDLWRARNAQDETQNVYRVGVMNTISESFVLQFGYADDQSIDTKILAAGFILIGPKFTLSYAINRETSFNNLLHSVDIRVPVW